MALAAMLSGQTFISVMDRISHANHQVHFANPLAGDVEYCSQGVHDCGDHHHLHGKNLAENHHPHGPVHHAGDAIIVFLAAHDFVLPGEPLPALRYELASPKFLSFHPLGPDHPPKPALAIRV